MPGYRREKWLLFRERSLIFPSVHRTQSSRAPSPDPLAHPGLRSDATGRFNGSAEPVLIEPSVLIVILPVRLSCHSKVVMSY